MTKRDVGFLSSHAQDREHPAGVHAELHQHHRHALAVMADGTLEQIASEAHHSQIPSTVPKPLVDPGKFTRIATQGPPPGQSAGRVHKVAVPTQAAPDEQNVELAVTPQLDASNRSVVTKQQGPTPPSQSLLRWHVHGVTFPPAQTDPD